MSKIIGASKTHYKIIILSEKNSRHDRSIIWLPLNDYATVDTISTLNDLVGRFISSTQNIDPASATRNEWKAAVANNETELSFDDWKLL